MQPSRTALALCVAALSSISIGRAAQSPWLLSPETKLVMPDPETSDQAGEAVYLQGDLAVVGARFHDHVLPNGTKLSNSGAAYVYARTANGWELEAELLPSDIASEHHFGSGVAIDEGTIVVAAQRHDGACPSQFFCDSGAVYVFVHDGTTWVEQAMLTPTDLEDADQFGGAVRIQGDTLVASSPFDRDVGSATGSAYVFTRTNDVWTQQQKLSASMQTFRTEFGYSLALDRDVLVIGARMDDHGSSSTLNYGSAYVFRNVGRTWVEETKLVPGDTFPNQRFGTSVSVDRSTIVIGAPGDFAPNLDSGAVYVFESDGGSWVEKAKFTAPGLAQDRFGQSVSVSGERFIAGKAPSLSGPGRAFAFRRWQSTWVPLLDFVGSDSTPFDRFGAAVSLSGDTVIVGAPWNSATSSKSGAAYIYDFVALFGAAR